MITTKGQPPRFLIETAMEEEELDKATMIANANKVNIDDYTDDEFELHRRRRSDPQSKQLIDTDLQQKKPFLITIRRIT